MKKTATLLAALLVAAVPTVSLFASCTKDEEKKNNEVEQGGEQQQEEQRHREQENRPTERSFCKKHDDHNGCQRKAHGHKAGQYPADRENKFWNIHLFNQSTVLQYGVHTHVGTLVEKCPQRLTGDQIQGKIRNIKPEHIAEYQCHNAHHQQRI